MSARETARGRILVRRAAKDGEQGIPGLIYRTSRWESGKEYRNDTDLTSTSDGFRYVDVVTDVDMAVVGTDTFNAYICKVTHTSSASIPLAEGTYWTKMNSLKPITTSLILASKILANYINVGNLAADNAFLTALTAESAFINKLIANTAFLTDLAAATAFINALTVKSLVTDSGKVTIANNGSITATDVNLTGTIHATSGDITDVKTKRLRNPFTEIEDSFTDVDDDTVYTESLGGGMHYGISIDWTTASSGRRMTIVGAFSTTAPTGKYFYYNGSRFSTLEASYQCTELLGWGTDSQFFGWIIMNRQLFQTNYVHGRDLRPLAFGRVQGTDSSVSFVNVKTCDGSTLYVTRLNEGKYYLYVPTTWFVSQSYIYCQLTSFGAVTGSSGNPCYANLYAITSGITYGSRSNYRLEIHTADDTSENDAGFQFMLFNMAGWDD